MSRVSEEVLASVLEKLDDPDYYHEHCKKTFKLRWEYVNAKMPYYQVIWATEEEQYRKTFAPSTTFEPRDDGTVLMTIIDPPVWRD